MTDLVARLRRKADVLDGGESTPYVPDVLRQAAAEIERLTSESDEAVRLWEARIEESRDKNQQIVLGDKAWKVRIESVRERLRAAEQRADTAEAERDHWVGAYNSELDRSIAAEARCAALTEALREAERLVATSDYSGGVAHRRMRSLLAPSGGER